MATYVMADIHGQYDMFMELLQKIDFKDEDTLYVLGDILDRGSNPIKTILKLMEMPNAICLLGNHEYMAQECLSSFLLQMNTYENLPKLNIAMMNNFTTWQSEGGQTTIDELCKLGHEERQDVLDFLKELSICEEISAGGKDYLLVHAGLGSIEPGMDIDEYINKHGITDFIGMKEFDGIDCCGTEHSSGLATDDLFIVSGHIPTQNIEGNTNPGYIFRHGNHIAIDCGACFPGGRLAALCLETGQEYYSSTNEK